MCVTLACREQGRDGDTLLWVCTASWSICVIRCEMDLMAAWLPMWERGALFTPWSSTSTSRNMKIWKWSTFCPVLRLGWAWKLKITSLWCSNFHSAVTFLWCYDAIISLCIVSNHTNYNLNLNLFSWLWMCLPELEFSFLNTRTQTWIRSWSWIRNRIWIHYPNWNLWWLCSNKNSSTGCKI